MLPPVIEHLLLHSKSFCKNVAQMSGGGNKMHPLNWGWGTNGKDSQYV